ncbi:MAG: hypothetical protein AB7V13_04160 [Pseudorhodoplanes sp.]|uniref:hypothetical protein n=1 Tax=Pseudorhodoplanes sp. TaxID=1934341 RepID=UPI003D0C1020
MRNTILMRMPAALLAAILPQAASAAPTIGAVALAAVVDATSPVEPVHYYGYGRAITVGTAVAITAATEAAITAMAGVTTADMAAATMAMAAAITVDR